MTGQWKPCPFCGDDGEKATQTVTQVKNDNEYQRILCRVCGAICPAANWNTRAMISDEQQTRLERLIAALEVLTKQQSG